MARSALAGRHNVIDWLSPEFDPELDRFRRMAAQAVRAEWAWVERVATELAARKVLYGPEILSLRPKGGRP